MKYLILCISILLALRLNAQVLNDPDLFLGQGVMIGEVSDQSAIFQTRLTGSEGLIGKDVPGKLGWARFVYWSHDGDQKSTSWSESKASQDYIIKEKVTDLNPGTGYEYRVEFGPDTINVKSSKTGTFKTNPGPDSNSPVNFVVVTGMNYYHFHSGAYDSTLMYMGTDKSLGYPALKSILELGPDYFIGTGDNVYFDHPAKRSVERALANGKVALPGLFDGNEVVDESGMRRKYHTQFVQPRFKDLFYQVGTYWEKDDHDYRINDSDPYTDFPISHELGIRNFREQLPVVDPEDNFAMTYRTIRMNKDLQLWFVEGRDYRNSNDDPDGPDKSIWGQEQKQWLYSTMKSSDARYKILISPTPMVGPDDAYKKDNHCNPEGFKTEGDAFFKWLLENDFSTNEFFIICGDRHWQYHAIHPSGFEEFSTGALVDANSRAGRMAGDPQSTDPDGLIKQLYIQGTREQASGGFLHVGVNNQNSGLVITFFDEMGKELYKTEK